MVDTPSAHESYNPTYFWLLSQVERRHFWFRARNAVIATAVRPYVAGLPPGHHVLEVGCGTGNVLQVLERVCPRATVVGVDLFQQGLLYARQRTAAPLVQADVHAPPFEACFSLVGLFDVLEHIPDDQQVLLNLRELLVDGGRLVITVPAHKSLWSYFDEASHHCRRYEKAELLQRLQQAGYVVERVTYFMASILPWVWLRHRLAPRLDRRAEQTLPKSDKLAFRELQFIPVLNELVLLVLLLEARLLAWRGTLPWGTSLLIVARKDSLTYPAKEYEV